MGCHDAVEELSRRDSCIAGKFFDERLRSHPEKTGHVADPRCSRGVLPEEIKQFRISRICIQRRNCGRGNLRHDPVKNCPAPRIQTGSQLQHILFPDFRNNAVDKHRIPTAEKRTSAGKQL